MEKHRIDDLAFFGGPPSFEAAIHVGRPNIPPIPRVLEQVERILEDRWLTNHGPMVEEFERRIADLVGCRHCVAVCNGTVALQLAIRGLGLDGEIIVPAFSFVATAHAVEWQGIKPVLVDIDRETHHIDPEAVAAAVTPKTTGIIGVHLWGRPCDTEGLEDVARRFDLKVLYDAAHAFGSRHRGIPIGNFGSAEVFSFHATKIVNCGEGGAIVTNDKDLAARLRLMKNFGFSGRDRVIHAGTNGKMSELAAVLGIEGLSCLEEFITKNRENLATYRGHLSEVPGVVLHGENFSGANCHYVVVEVDAGETCITRDRILNLLTAENILARRYFFPGIHRMQPYRDNDSGLRLPITEAVADRIMVLPTGHSISEDEIIGICRLIRFIVEKGPEISERMNHQAGPASTLPDVRKMQLVHPVEEAVRGSIGGDE